MQRDLKALAITALLSCLLSSCGEEPTQPELPISQTPSSPSDVKAPILAETIDDPEPTNDSDIDDTLPDSDDGRAVEKRITTLQKQSKAVEAIEAEAILGGVQETHIPSLHIDFFHISSFAPRSD